jgi:4-hydroxyphenylacetate 3-monooxygenase
VSPAQAEQDEFRQVGVAEERDDGIVVRGAQMLGTSSTVSDYLLVSCIKPLAPGDESFALTFVVPVQADGLKFVCRRPYAKDAPSTFDYPLSSRFDETDALVMFDDVFVPWEQVFAYRDRDAVRDQWHVTGAHVLGNSQAQMRLAVKMKFLVGLARRIAEVNGLEKIPAVQEKLADISSLAAIVEGMTIASEDQSFIDDNGLARPHPRFLYGAMGLQAELYPRALSLVRELAGAGVVQVPSSFKDLNGPVGHDIRRHLGANGKEAEERIKLFKLVWDAIGSEFAGRHHQYEMFYAGAPFVAKGYAFRNYGFDEALALVDQTLESYDLPSDDVA